MFVPCKRYSKACWLIFNCYYLFYLKTHTNKLTNTPTHTEINKRISDNEEKYEYQNSVETVPWMFGFKSTLLRWQFKQKARFSNIWSIVFIDPPVAITRFVRTFLSLCRGRAEYLTPIVCDKFLWQHWSYYFSLRAQTVI